MFRNGLNKLMVLLCLMTFIGLPLTLLNAEDEKPEMKIPYLVRENDQWQIKYATTMEEFEQYILLGGIDEVAPAADGNLTRLSSASSEVEVPAARTIRYWVTKTVGWDKLDGHGQIHEEPWDEWITTGNYTVEYTGTVMRMEWDLTSWRRYYGGEPIETHTHGSYETPTTSIVYRIFDYARFRDAYRRISGVDHHVYHEEVTLQYNTNFVFNKPEIPSGQAVISATLKGSDVTGPVKPGPVEEKLQTLLEFEPGDPNQVDPCAVTAPVTQFDPKMFSHSPSLLRSYLPYHN